MAVLTLLVGMTSGSAVEVNISNAVRISASWEGVRPVETDLPDFRRLEGGYVSENSVVECTIGMTSGHLHKFKFAWVGEFS